MKAVCLFVCWLACALCCGAQPALAQTPAIAAVQAVAAKPAPPPPRVLTPAEARAVLDVLQNDAKRTQFVAVLQSMAKVQAATAAKSGGVSFNPGSLGAELLTATSGSVSRAADELLKMARTLTNVALFRAWLTSTLTDPDSQARLIDAAEKLALLVVAGSAAEWLVRRGLARWRDGINRSAPHDDPANIAPETAHRDPPLVPDPAGPDADTQRSRVPPGKPTSWALLRRIPFVVLRLLIDLAPILAFGAVVYLALATPLGRAREARLVVLGLVDAYLAVGVGVALLRALLSPHSTALRLIHMSDASAAYLLRWARRFLVVGVFGYAIDQTGLLFGMYEPVHDVLVKLIALILTVFALVVVLQCRAAVARKLRAPAGAHGAWPMVRNRAAELWHVLAIICIVAFWIISAFEVRQGYAALARNAAIVAAIVLGARLASIVLLGGLDRLLHLRPETVARYPGIDMQTGRYTPLLRLLINLALALIAGLVLLQFWGVPVSPWVRHGTLGGRIVDALTTSGLIVLIAIVVWEGVNTGIQGHLARLARDGQFARSARLRTLLPMLRTTMLVVIFVFAALMIMSQIGVNTAPLLAGAGVVGIAIGFGSQKLVQDVITGLFLLLENAMQVGDTVALAGLTGTVENLSIRTIRLRALDGAVHVIPFSAVTTVTNSTRDYGYAVLDVSAGYNEEPDHIADVLRGVAAEMRADGRWHDAMEDDIDIQGVDKFLDNAWVLRARVKTRPAERLPVQREFNRRLKYRFDQLAIESPFTSPRILSTVPAPPSEPELAAAALQDAAH